MMRFRPIQVITRMWELFRKEQDYRRSYLPMLALECEWATYEQCLLVTARSRRVDNEQIGVVAQILLARCGRGKTPIVDAIEKYDTTLSDHECVALGFRDAKDFQRHVFYGKKERRTLFGRMSNAVVGNPPWWFGHYWKRRCLAVERRMDELEDTIHTLKGHADAAPE